MKMITQCSCGKKHFKNYYGKFCKCGKFVETNHILPLVKENQEKLEELKIELARKIFMRK
jgi:hypothetical protein